MNESDCAEQVGRLVAAFPRESVGVATVNVYVGALRDLQYPEALRDAVDVLIRDELRLPKVAEIRETYRRYRDRYEPKGLPEAEPTDEERAENLRRWNELQERLA